MTPLAHRIAKELTRPLRDRAFIDDGGILHQIGEMHCFEITEAFPLIQEIAIKIHEIARTGDLTAASYTVGKLTFLPAPKTWIEWRDDVTGARLGALLSEEDTNKFGLVFVGETRSERKPSMASSGPLLLHDADWGGPIEKFLLAALFAINSPKVVMRRQHMPHAGLERALTKALKPTGKFPLQAWTEILLKVRAPSIDGEEHESHLTGRKALHFCRAHLRMRCGRLEHVTSHWRGDPALGIKRSRYKVVP